MAKLYFEHGTMGSGKSTSVLATQHDYEEGNRWVLLAKPASDTKGYRLVVSRMGISREVDFLITPGMDVEAEVQERKRLGNFALSALLIDEAQFLRPRQVDQLLRLAVLGGVPVLAWGLRTDFQTHSFPGSRRLLEIAHVTREAIAMCSYNSNGEVCESRAHLNARLVNGAYVTEGAQVAIDGVAKVTYAALCTSHYMANVGPVASSDS